MQRCDHKEGPWEHEGAVGTLANGRLCRYKEVPRHHRYSSRHVIYTCCGRRWGGKWSMRHKFNLFSVRFQDCLPHLYGSTTRPLFSTVLFYLMELI